MAKKNVEEIEELEELEDSEDNIAGKEVSGDGHRPNISQEELDVFEERELDRQIPGRGHLFHVKKKHLHESTRLNKKMIMAFAIGDVQQAVLNHTRTESVFEILKNAIMGYEISEDGEGRKESIILHQLTSEEKEAAAQGGLFGQDK